MSFYVCIYVTNHPSFKHATCSLSPLFFFFFNLVFISFYSVRSFIPTFRTFSSFPLSTILFLHLTFFFFFFFSFFFSNQVAALIVSGLNALFAWLMYSTGAHVHLINLSFFAPSVATDLALTSILTVGFIYAIVTPWTRTAIKRGKVVKAATLVWFCFFLHFFYFSTCANYLSRREAMKGVKKHKGRTGSSRRQFCFCTRILFPRALILFFLLWS